MSGSTNPSEIAKIVALKSFLLVWFSESSEARSEMKQIAIECTRRLANATDLRDIRRRCFYWLVLAELARTDDPSDYRVSAQADGEELMRLGADSPFVYYMTIVSATTRKMTTADFGDFNSSCRWSHGGDWWSEDPIDDSVDDSTIWPAQDLLDLTEESLSRHDKFLRDWSLREIAVHHGLLDGEDEGTPRRKRPR